MSHHPQPLSAAKIREHLADSPRNRFPPVDPPATDEQTFDWLYPDGGFELALLHRIVAEGFAANAFVHYAKNIGPVPTRAVFERDAPRDSQIEVRSTGSIKILVDGTEVTPHITSEGLVCIDPVDEGQIVHVEVTAEQGKPAALAVPRETSGQWTSRHKPVKGRPGGVTPPHLLDEPIRVLPLIAGTEATEGLLDVGIPVLGRPVLECVGVPVLSSGESPEEALAGTSETHHEVVQREDGRWTTRHRLGFRYLHVEGAHVEAVHVEANLRDLPAGGAFACSDSTLNDIWTTADYTLRVCMQSLVLDGIKRDRMPWLGDQALNSVTNAFTVGDGQIIRDGLSALGRPVGGYVNGIADYSLWWLINRSFLSLYFEAADADDADRIAGFVADLDSHATPTGVFRPAAHGDDFVGAGGGPVFIDWGVTFDASRDLTALQMLWYWALTSAADVLASQDHAAAARYTERAEQICSTLWATAWDHDVGAWKKYLDGGDTDSAYPNMLAVLAGLHDGPVPPGVQTAIRRGRTGTPFMTGFALRAQARAGDTEGSIERLQDLWSSMLDAGHGTFWEEFNTPGMSPFEMYGRPFGKSLCHAWGSAPAALLPEILLGIRPTENGWKRFTVQPALGHLDWAAAIVPTPHGEIFVSAGPDDTIIDIPAGTAYIHPDGSLTHGPARKSLGCRTAAA
jgi:alpha-L-rhamnosidase